MPNFTEFDKCKVCGMLYHKHAPDCPNASMSALDTQVKGDHYKKCFIQPIEYITLNKLSFAQGNIVKYATRYKDKNGVEDLMKIKHYVDLILQLEYNINNPKEVEY